MGNWNDTCFVLPENDDIYEVIIGPLCIQTKECYYDGKGFLFRGEYINAAHWRTRIQDLPKRYGKVT